MCKDWERQSLTGSVAIDSVASGCLWLELVRGPTGDGVFVGVDGEVGAINDVAVTPDFG